jgi:hypothetical protein
LLRSKVELLQVAGKRAGRKAKNQERDLLARKISSFPFCVYETKSMSSFNKTSTPETAQPDENDAFSRENQHLSVLVEVAEILGQESDFHEILRVVANKAASLLRAEIALIMMINPLTRQTVKTVIKAGQEVNNPDFALSKRKSSAG